MHHSKNTCLMTRIATMSNDRLKSSVETAYLWEHELAEPIYSLLRKINSDIKAIRMRMNDPPDERDTIEMKKYDALNNLAIDREKELQSLKKEMDSIKDRYEVLVKNPKKNKIELDELKIELENSNLNSRADEAHKVYEIKKTAIEQGKSLRVEAKSQRVSDSSSQLFQPSPDQKKIKHTKHTSKRKHTKQNPDQKHSGLTKK